MYRPIRLFWDVDLIHLILDFNSAEELHRVLRFIQRLLVYTGY